MFSAAVSAGRALPLFLTTYLGCMCRGVNEGIYIGTQDRTYINGANVSCFLSSLLLFTPATTAVFGSYMPSLYSLLPLYRRCDLA
jgi:hypothetical protein